MAWDRGVAHQFGDASSTTRSGALRPARKRHRASARRQRGNCRCCACGSDSSRFDRAREAADAGDRPRARATRVRAGPPASCRRGAARRHRHADRRRGDSDRCRPFHTLRPHCGRRLSARRPPDRSDGPASRRAVRVFPRRCGQPRTTQQPVSATAGWRRIAGQAKERVACPVVVVLWAPSRRRSR